jgi:hypothetical protein
MADKLDQVWRLQGVLNAVDRSLAALGWVHASRAIAITEGAERLRERVQALETERDRLANGLLFYADPETYFAIGFHPDSPCGPFIDDFSETDLGEKPGKLARKLLEDSKALYQEPREDVEDQVMDAVRAWFDKEINVQMFWPGRPAWLPAYLERWRDRLTIKGEWRAFLNDR